MGAEVFVSGTSSEVESRSGSGPHMAQQQRASGPSAAMGPAWSQAGGEGDHAVSGHARP